VFRARVFLSVSFGELRAGGSAPRGRSRIECAAATPNGRCKVHGGKSTGPRTPEGLERSRSPRALCANVCGECLSFDTAKTPDRMRHARRLPLHGSHRCRARAHEVHRSFLTILPPPSITSSAVQRWGTIQRGDGLSELPGLRSLATNSGARQWTDYLGWSNLPYCFSAHLPHTQVGIFEGGAQGRQAFHGCRPYIPECLSGRPSDI
jgi:hypothetical protein